VRPTRLAATSGDAEAPAVNVRVVGDLPAELLQPGEIIILLLKPSPWFIVLTCLRSLASLTLALMLGLTLVSRGYPLGLGKSDMLLAFIALAFARLLWQFFEWLGQTYVMTDRRLIRVAGFLNVSVFEAPLAQVTHTSTHFSLKERLLGLGTIGFATAGTDSFDAYWVMLAHPLSVHQVVVQTLNRYGRR
jgi:hypothetical protein